MLVQQNCLLDSKKRKYFSKSTDFLRQIQMNTHTATAQAHPNIAFIKCTLAKLGRSNRKVCFDVRFVPS